GDRLDRLSAGRDRRPALGPGRAAAGRAGRPVRGRGHRGDPGRGGGLAGLLGSRQHLPAHPGGVRRGLPGGARRRRLRRGVAAPVPGAVRHLGLGPARGRRGRRRACPGGRLPLRRHGPRLRRARGGGGGRRRRHAAGGLRRGGGHRRAHDHPVLRRHPRTPAPRWPDRRRAGAAGHRAVDEAHPARPGGPYRPAGEGPDHQQGHRPARGAGRGRRGRPARGRRRAASGRGRAGRGAGRPAAVAAAGHRAVLHLGDRGGRRGARRPRCPRRGRRPAL
ncbi:MAG: DegV family protein, partial [uncultured Corynebacteriales bacterium]